MSSCGSVRPTDYRSGAWSLKKLLTSEKNLDLCRLCSMMSPSEDDSSVKSQLLKRTRLVTGCVSVFYSGGRGKRPAPMPCHIGRAQRNRPAWRSARRGVEWFCQTGATSCVDVRRARPKPAGKAWRCRVPERGRAVPPNRRRRRRAACCPQARTSNR